MPSSPRLLRSATLALAMLIATAIGPLWLMASDAKEGEQANEQQASQKAAVRVATLIYANGKTSKCFAPGFLTTVARHTKINVDRDFASATLGKDDLHNHPFVIMTGDGSFSLSKDEQQAFKSYIQRGGFILASSSCSSQEWTTSFRSQMKDMFPNQAMDTLAMEHPVFNTIYDLRELQGRKGGTRGVLEGLTIDGRLVVIFSAMGLNDTENAGGGCCCCGGNELREAHRINANVLAYVLTH